MANEKPIIANVIIEMLGSPKEHIASTLKEYVEKIEEDYKEIRILKKDLSEPKEKEDEKGLFNVFAEIELEVSGIENLTWFCIDYMPSSVDIIEPSEILYDSGDLTGFMNDLLSKLHQIGGELKKLNILNKTLGNNGVALLKNLILLQLKSGAMTSEELSKGAGAPIDHIEQFLKIMLKDNLITKTDDKYVLTKK